MTTRPQLDSMALWRAQQVALREGRSLANAINRMIEESWNARMDTAMALTAPALKDEREAVAATCAAHMPASRIAAVKKICEEETRSMSQVINILVREALAQRAKTANAPSA